MLNKLIPKSPIGIALTAASLILALSPEARKFTRRAAVKGMAGVLSLVDQVKGVTGSTKEQISGFVDEARRSHSAEQENHQTFIYNRDIEPVPFTDDSDFSLPAYNVVSDDFLKKQAMESFPELH